MRYFRQNTYVVVEVLNTNLILEDIMKRVYLIE